MPCYRLLKAVRWDRVSTLTLLPIWLAAKTQLLPNRSAAIITSMVIALFGTITGASHAEDVNISNRRNSERTSFTNDEIRDGFFKIAFDAELQLGKGRDKAKQIRQSLNPQCLSGFGKDRQYRIRHAEVILPVDASDFTFYDCAYEELLQALGPINDDPSVPWTMFNDDVQMGFFDVYDSTSSTFYMIPGFVPG